MKSEYTASKRENGDNPSHSGGMVDFKYGKSDRTYINSLQSQKNEGNSLMQGPLV